MPTDFSKIGRASKRKGHEAELESAKFWSEKLGTVMRRTPLSGGFAMDFKGDIFDMGDSILRDFVIDRKCGKQVPKKLTQWMEKLSDEAQGKMCFLETSSPYKEVMIIIKRKDFARLLVELQGWRKQYGK